MPVKNEKPRTSRVAQSFEERLANAKKIGQRDETTQEVLSPSQIQDTREKICGMLWELEGARAAKRAAAAKHSARIKELEADMASLNIEQRVGKRDVTISVEEYLTGRNEVIRVRADTREILGNRVARPEDLQEPMFEDVDEDAVVTDDPDGVARTVRDARDADDFGDNEAPH